MYNPHEGTCLCMCMYVCIRPFHSSPVYRGTRARQKYVALSGARTPTCTYINTYIHTYIHTYMSAFISIDPKFKKCGKKNLSCSHSMLLIMLRTIMLFGRCMRASMEPIQEGLRREKGVASCYTDQGTHQSVSGPSKIDRAGFGAADAARTPPSATRNISLRLKPEPRRCCSCCLIDTDNTDAREWRSEMAGTEKQQALSAKHAMDSRAMPSQGGVLNMICIPTFDYPSEDSFAGRFFLSVCGNSKRPLIGGSSPHKRP